MDLVEVVEARTRLLVPPSAREAAAGVARGPAARDAAVFFNPAMAFSRDLGVLAVAALAAERGRPARILDGLAAAGARGLRYAVEAGAEATLNDWNPKAGDLARRNAEANGVEATIERRNLGSLLWEGAWDLVDVDPFGSPAPFVDAAARAVVNGGLLAITATDTAALHGLYPEVCRRRYLATPMRGEVGHEVALRILAGFLARQAAKHDVALVPVLSHASDHYYRVYARAARGADRANRALARLGSAWLCEACGARGLGDAAPPACPACRGTPRAAGPLWEGPLHDADFVAGMAAAANDRVLARDADVRRHLALFADEAGAPPLFFDAHEAASRADVDPWPLDALVPALRAAGHAATRTHVSPVAVRTDATEAELRALMRPRGRGQP